MKTNKHLSRFVYGITIFLIPYIAMVTDVHASTAMRPVIRGPREVIVAMSPTFICDFEAFTNVTRVDWYWYQGLTNIASAYVKEQKTISSDRYAVRLVRYSVHLTIERITANDENRLECYISYEVYETDALDSNRTVLNVKQSLPASWTYRLQDKSDAPVNVQVIDIQERQVLLNWKLPEDKGNSRIEKYEVGIFNASVYQIRNVINHCASEQYCVRATVSGLSPNYVYTFRVRIFNNILWSDYSNFTAKITTKYEGPSKPTQLRILIVNASEVSPNGIPYQLNLTWQQPEETYGAVIVDYEIFYKSDLGEHTNWTRRNYIALNQYINPGELFIIRVRARSYAESKRYNGLNASLEYYPPEIAPYPPISVTTAIISPVSVRIIWAPSKWIAKPELSYYIVRYERFNNHSDDQHHHGSSDAEGGQFHDANLIEIKTDNGAQLSIVISGLLPFQSYRISISAVNKLRNGTEMKGQFSRYVENRTSKLAPAYVCRPVLDPYNYEALIKFSPAPEINGTIDSYEVILVQLTDEEDTYINQNTPEGVYSSIISRNNRSAIRQSSHVAFVALTIGEKQIKSIRDAHAPESDDSCRSDSQKSFREFLSSGEIEQGQYYTALVAAYVVTVIDGVKQNRHTVSNFSKILRIADQNDIAVLMYTAVSVSALIAVSLLIFSVHLYRKKTSKELLIANSRESFDIGIGNDLQSIRAKAEYEKSVPIELFLRHVSTLHENTDLGFYNEFESISYSAMSKNITWTHSLNPVNKAKNRYDNVVAYDHTRVKLNSIGDDLGSSYINANFIKTNGKVKTIIATQGPLPNTMGDFWRMIWEQRVNVIVMITNILEKGRRKCERYWPENGKNETFGAISVTLTKETIYPEYTIRHMNVKKVERTAKMFNTVKQFHYTCWPDHGVPNNTNGIMKFIKKSVAANILASAPIVVHCSAGVGRTGTYIVLETMMKCVDDACDINIYKFVSDIRSQRNMMVQTESQYIFIHDALVEYILFGYTDIYYRNFKEKSSDEKSFASNLANEFKSLVAIELDPADYYESRRKYNRHKNISAELCYLPSDATRVILQKRPGIDGSDYINASYIDGYYKPKAFVITTYPFQDTVNDFWRMIWENEIALLISFVGTSITFIGNNQIGTFSEFIPSSCGDAIIFDNMEVEFSSVERLSGINVEILKISLVNNPRTGRTLRHIRFYDFAAGSSVTIETITEVLHLLRYTNEIKKKETGIDRITLIHGNESGSVGIFCILMNVIDQLDDEGYLDIYHAGVLIQRQRPLITNVDQYRYCYDTMLKLVEDNISGETEV